MILWEGWVGVKGVVCFSKPRAERVGAKGSFAKKAKSAIRSPNFRRSLGGQSRNSTNYERIVLYDYDEFNRTELCTNDTGAQLVPTHLEAAFPVTPRL